MKTDITILCFGGLFLSLAGLDYISTMYAIERGIGYETNPLMAELINSPYLLFIKLGGTLIIIGLLHYAYSKDQKNTKTCMTIIICMMLFVVLSNFIGIAIMGGVKT